MEEIKRGKDRIIGLKSVCEVGSMSVRLFVCLFVRCLCVTVGVDKRVLIVPVLVLI